MEERMDNLESGNVAANVVALSIFPRAPIGGRQLYRSRRSKTRGDVSDSIRPGCKTLTMLRVIGVTPFDRDNHHHNPPPTLTSWPSPSRRIA